MLTNDKYHSIESRTRIHSLETNKYMRKINWNHHMRKMARTKLPAIVHRDEWKKVMKRQAGVRQERGVEEVRRTKPRRDTVQR